MTAPLTLIVEGKPLVFDVPVPVGEVIPAGTCFVGVDGDYWEAECAPDETFILEGPYRFFTARTPVAPEAFADGDVAWVRFTKPPTHTNWWAGDGLGGSFITEENLSDLIADGTAFALPSPRPESLADVLDDANLPDELRARIEKAAAS